MVLVGRGRRFLSPKRGTPLRRYFRKKRKKRTKRKAARP